MKCIQKIMSISLFFSLSTVISAEVTYNVPTVSIMTIADHPSLNLIRNGVIDELKSQGYDVDKGSLKLNYQSAQGNMANLAQIAKLYASNESDVIVPITTPSAQTIAASTKTIPIVFAGVTDPVAAKLISNFDASGSNITGVSDKLDLEPQIELMKSLVPNIKNVGFVYSPNEINSTVVLTELKKALAKQNINIVAMPALRTSEIPTAAGALVGKVDLIFTTTDNNVVSSYESLVKVADQYHIPLIASFPEAVDRGAVAALGTSYYDLGRESGKMVVKILQGNKVGIIKPEISNKTELLLNLNAAKKQHVMLDKKLLDQAIKIIP